MNDFKVGDRVKERESKHFTKGAVLEVVELATLNNPIVRVIEGEAMETVKDYLLWQSKGVVCIGNTKLEKAIEKSVKAFPKLMISKDTGTLWWMTSCYQGTLISSDHEHYSKGHKFLASNFDFKMLDIELKFKPNYKAPGPFPKLRFDPVDQSVLWMTSVRAGTVVCTGNNDSLEIGQYSTNWKGTEHMVDFEGDILGEIDE